MEEKLRFRPRRIHFLSPRCLQGSRRQRSRRDSPEGRAASQLPVNHRSYLEVGRSGRQPEHLLVGVASAAPTSLGPVGPDWLTFRTAALFRDASRIKQRLKKSTCPLRSMLSLFMKIIISEKRKKRSKPILLAILGLESVPGLQQLE